MSQFEKKITEFKERLNKSKNLNELHSINSEIFGKNGVINLEFKKLGSIPVEEKKIFAASINKIKQELSDIYKAKSSEILDKDIIEKVKKEKIDVTLPEKEFKVGKVRSTSD